MSTLGKEIRADRYSSLKPGRPVTVVTVALRLKGSEEIVVPSRRFQGLLVYAETYAHAVYDEKGYTVVRREERPLRIAIAPASKVMVKWGSIRADETFEMLQLYSNHFEAGTFKMYEDAQ